MFHDKFHFIEMRDYCHNNNGHCKSLLGSLRADESSDFKTRSPSLNSPSLNGVDLTLHKVRYFAAE